MTTKKQMRERVAAKHDARVAAEKQSGLAAQTRGLNEQAAEKEALSVHLTKHMSKPVQKCKYCNPPIKE